LAVAHAQTAQLIASVKKKVYLSVRVLTGTKEVQNKAKEERTYLAQVKHAVLAIIDQYGI
jgi:hypothetical protein